MTTQAELLHLLRIHPDTPRIGGYGHNTGIIRDKSDDNNPNKAIAITVQLIDPDTFEPSDTWLALQLQPDDAMVLAKCILQVAKDRGWKEPDADIIRTGIATHDTKH